MHSFCAITKMLRYFPKLSSVRKVLTEYKNLLAKTHEDDDLKHCCRYCPFHTTTEQGLHIHEAKMHRDKLDHYVPLDFLPEHSMDGLPTCAACHKNFALWKGLKDHLPSLQRAGSLTTHGRSAL